MAYIIDTWAQKIYYPSSTIFSLLNRDDPGELISNNCWYILHVFCIQWIKNVEQVLPNDFETKT